MLYSAGISKHNEQVVEALAQALVRLLQDNPGIGNVK